MYDFDTESTDEYNADIKMTLLNWFAEKNSGALSPRESLDDHPFMAKLNKLKDTIVYHLKRNLRPDELGMKGDNARIVREQFDKFKPKLLEEGPEGPDDFPRVCGGAGAGARYRTGIGPCGPVSQGCRVPHPPGSRDESKGDKGRSCGR